MPEPKAARGCWNCTKIEAYGLKKILNSACDLTVAVKDGGSVRDHGSNSRREEARKTARDVLRSTSLCSVDCRTESATLFRLVGGA